MDLMTVLMVLTDCSCAADGRNLSRLRHPLITTVLGAVPGDNIKLVPVPNRVKDVDFM